MHGTCTRCCGARAGAIRCSEARVAERSARWRPRRQQAALARRRRFRFRGARAAGRRVGSRSEAESGVETSGVALVVSVVPMALVACAWSHAGSALEAGPRSGTGAATERSGQSSEAGIGPVTRLVPRGTVGAGGRSSGGGASGPDGGTGLGCACVKTGGRLMRPGCSAASNSAGIVQAGVGGLACGVGSWWATGGPNGNGRSGCGAGAGRARCLSLASSRL